MCTVSLLEMFGFFVGSIACVAWNEQFDKLTTADTNGMIIVWMNHECTVVLVY
jgi:hypothetical protein